MPPSRDLDQPYVRQYVSKGSRRLAEPHDNRKTLDGPYWQGSTQQRATGWEGAAARCEETSRPVPVVAPPRQRDRKRKTRAQKRQDVSDSVARIFAERYGTDQGERGEEEDMPGMTEGVAYLYEKVTHPQPRDPVTTEEEANRAVWPTRGPEISRFKVPRTVEAWSDITRPLSAGISYSKCGKFEHRIFGVDLVSTVFSQTYRGTLRCALDLVSEHQRNKSGSKTQAAAALYDELLGYTVNNLARIANTLPLCNHNTVMEHRDLLESLLSLGRKAISGETLSDSLTDGENMARAMFSLPDPEQTNSRHDIIVRLFGLFPYAMFFGPLGITSDCSPPDVPRRDVKRRLLANCPIYCPSVGDAFTELLLRAWWELSIICVPRTHGDRFSVHGEFVGETVGHPKRPSSVLLLLSGTRHQSTPRTAELWTEFPRLPVPLSGRTHFLKPLKGKSSHMVELFEIVESDRPDTTEVALAAFAKIHREDTERTARLTEQRKKAALKRREKRQRRRDESPPAPEPRAEEIAPPEDQIMRDEDDEDGDEHPREPKRARASHEQAEDTPPYEEVIITEEIEEILTEDSQQNEEDEDDPKEKELEGDGDNGHETRDSTSTLREGAEEKTDEDSSDDPSPATDDDKEDGEEEDDDGSPTASLPTEPPSVPSTNTAPGDVPAPPPPYRLVSVRLSPVDLGETPERSADPSRFTLSTDTEDNGHSEYTGVRSPDCGVPLNESSEIDLCTELPGTLPSPTRPGSPCSLPFIIGPVVRSLRDGSTLTYSSGCVPTSPSPVSSSASSSFGQTGDFRTAMMGYASSPSPPHSSQSEGGMLGSGEAVDDILSLLLHSTKPMVTEYVVPGSKPADDGDRDQIPTDGAIRGEDMTEDMLQEQRNVETHVADQIASLECTRAVRSFSVPVTRQTILNPYAVEVA